MKVAVLMSTYNGERYIEEQMESLEKQTISNCITIYVRDDGSTDHTVEIIKKWSKKLDIKLLREKNIGPAKSFWKLLTDCEIEADYYAFCDQDDIWDKNKLQKAVDILKINSMIHLYCCNCRYIDAKGIVQKERARKERPDISIQRLFVTGIAQGCSMVFTRKLYDYIRTKNIQCIPMHDLILTLYALQYGSVYWDENPRFSYRIHENNVVAKGNKTIVGKVKKVLWNWNNSSKNSMEIVAREMLNNCEKLSEQEKKFLIRMSQYKENIKYRVWLLFYDRNVKESHATLRSYRIRLILGLL